VIESISTTASYEEGSPDVITIPAPKSKGAEELPAGRGGSTILIDGGGGSDPYESLYKGS
jgi:hypothetical protein